MISPLKLKTHESIESVHSKILKLNLPKRVKERINIKSDKLAQLLSPTSKKVCLYLNILFLKSMGFPNI